MSSIYQLPSAGQYTADYIRKAFNNKTLPAPDKVSANGNYETLISLYDAFKLGGNAAARASWETLLRLRPELAEFDPNRLPKLIHADELKNLSAPMYLLEYYPFYKFGFNVLAGPSGSGKSFVALDCAGRIAVEEAVVYIAGEGLHGYAARWEAWKDFNKADTAELYFYTEALQVMEQSQLSEFIGLIAEHRPALVIIDTLARSAVGMEENSAKEMGSFVGACDALRTALNTSILVVHHTGKSGEIRGSTALYGAADSVLSVKMSDGLVSVTNDPDGGGKNKHSPAAGNKYFKIIPHPVEEFAGAVLIETQQMTISKEDKLTDKQEAILDAVEGYESGVDPLTIINTTGLSQATVYRNLKQLLQLGYLTFDKGYYLIKEGGFSF